MATLTIQQAFDLAVQHHRAGRLDQAEPLYRQILAQQPKHVGALQLLGVIADQVGRHDIAVELIRQSIALDPNAPGAHHNLANALSNSGQVDEAIVTYRQAIAIRPDHAEAYAGLGTALKKKGLLDEAIAAFRQAIALKPGYAEAHSNLGNALQGKGQLDEAIAACRQAIALKPGLAEAYSNLGNALREKGHMDEALAACRQAVALKPGLPGAYNLLGICLTQMGQLDEAIAAHRQAIVLNSSFAEAYSSLGVALQRQGRLDDAVAAQRRAIVLQPGLPEAYGNLGIALSEQGHLDEAITNHRRAIALKPNLPEAHRNLAVTLLTKGQFAEGWEEYEWRWRCKEFPEPSRNFPQPQWDGSPLQGRSILIHAEQGFGDTIQFIRYLPEVVQRGGKLIVQCQKQLWRLVRTMAGDWPVIERGASLPEFDVQCPLLSLPRALGATLENIPRKIRYLQAEAKDIEKWRMRLESEGPAIKVGLAWAGHPNKYKNNQHRLMTLASFAPLAQVPGVRFYSLQKGRADRTGPPGLQLTDWTAELNDFADTAALIANLDLVIAVDTAVVHLAGAMGRPVWTLLPFAADWRWLLERADCPWYPTMRLFRQPAIGDWDSVMRQVAERLARWPN